MKSEKFIIKNYKTILTLIMLIFAVMFFSKNTYALSTSSLTISPTSKTLKVGETVEIVVTQKVSSYGSWGINQTSNYDPTVINVESKGKEYLTEGIGSNFKYKITALKPGTATLSFEANDNNKTATCKITVVSKDGSNANAVNIPASMDIKVGETKKIQLPQYSSLGYGYRNAYGTVDGVLSTNGDYISITGKTVGKLEYYVKIDGKEYVCNITVKSKDGNSTVPATGIKVLDQNGKELKGTITMKMGESLKIKPVLTPSDSTDVFNTSYTNMNIKTKKGEDGKSYIDSSDGYWTYTPKAVGDASITINSYKTAADRTNKNLNKTIELKIKVLTKEGNSIVPATGIKVLDQNGKELKGTITMKMGESLKIKPVLTPSNSTDVFNTSYTNMNIKTKKGEDGKSYIDSSDGYWTYTPKAVGDASITINSYKTAADRTNKNLNKTIELKITVKSKSVEVTGIKLDASSKTMNVGDTATLKATISPTDATTKSVTWTSSDSKVVTVDKSGNLKAIKAGTAIITAKSNNEKEAKCTITVKSKSVAVKEVTLNATNRTMNVGETYVLTATINPSNATNKNIKWTSSDSNIVKVSEGKLTAVKAGTATITAKSNNEKTATCKVTVKEVAEIGTPAVAYKKDMKVGDSIKVSTLFENYGVKNVTLKQLTIKDNNKILGTTATSSINDKGEKSSAEYLKALKAGKATVIYDGKEAYISVEITVKEVAEIGTPAVAYKKDMKVGDSIKVSTLFENYGVKNVTLKQLTIKDNNKILGTTATSSINDKGEKSSAEYLKALKAGKATVIYDGKEAYITVEITINNVEVKKVTLNAANKNMTVGDTATLTATIEPTNATNKKVTWTSSDSSIVKVSEGKLTAVKAGTATITAKAGNKAATCKVTVKAKQEATVSSISIKANPSKTAYNKGDKLDLKGGKITVTYSDKSTKVLEMTAKGVTVTGYDQNNARNQKITVKYGEKTAWFTVTVAVNYKAYKGDINRDNQVNSKDMNLINNYLYGNGRLTGEQKYIADMNGDGKIDASDRLTMWFVSIGLSKKNEITVNYIPGDVDGDGKVTVADGQLALRASAKLEKLSKKQMVAADVNGDGDILADDARTIERRASYFE